jgi:hypothetical protein
MNLRGRSALLNTAPEMWSYELCLAAINDDITALDDIKKNQKGLPLTEGQYIKLLNAAKDKYGVEATFHYFPPEMRTYGLCLEFIKQNKYGLNLLAQPDDRAGLKSGEYEQLCLAAIDIDAFTALSSIEPEMRSYKLCLAAVNRTPTVFILLDNPAERIGLKPEEFNQLCLDGIAIDACLTLESMDPQRRNYERCLAAVNKDMFALQIIQNKRDRPALKIDEYAAICLAALKVHGNTVLDDIAKSMWTYDLCIAAVTNNMQWLKQLNKNRKLIKLTSTEYTNIFLEAFKLHGTSALRYFPPAMYTYNVFKNIVKQDVRALSYLQDPDDRDRFEEGEYRKLCLEVIDSYGSKNINDILSDIDEDELDEVLLTTAVNKNVNALQTVQQQLNEKRLDKDKFMSIWKAATNKYGIKETFSYLLAEMKENKISLEDAQAVVDVIKYFKSVNREELKPQQYTDLAFLVLKKEYINNIDSNLPDGILRSFINRYESTNRFNDYKMRDISVFFEENKHTIKTIYTLLGKHAFTLMENILITSDDKLNRFLVAVEKSTAKGLASCSKNISRLFENIDQNNAGILVSQFKSYLQLPNEDKEQINILLDDNDTKIETVQNMMREFLVKNLYDSLKLPYDDNMIKHLTDTLTYTNLVNLNGLLETHKTSPKRSQSKIFISMLKIYLGDIPFQYLHQPEKIKIYSDTHLEEMATHNKKLRDELAAKGINVNQAFNYQKQTPLTFDEHQKKKILEVTDAIYTKIKNSGKDNKSIKNLINEIEKKEKDSKQNKLLKMLSEGNLRLLKTIADTVLPDINTDYLELIKLKNELTINSEGLKNYTQRKFHIEMWDKSKVATLFLGDYLSCCLATDGKRNTDYAVRVFDDAFLMPVIIDETTKKPVCGAWLFLGNATQPPSTVKTIDTVANFFDMNAGLAQNTDLQNFLMVNLLNYIDQFSKAIHAAEFIMKPMGYGKLKDFNEYGTFSRTHERQIEKFGGYGYISKGEEYFLDALNTQNFYKFEPAQFSEAMKKHIVPEPEPTKSEYASNITWGFAEKPSNVSSSQDQPAQKTPGPTLSNQ